MGMTNHLGYVGVSYEELESCIGLPALVVERVSEPRRRPVYNLYFGVIAESPISPSAYEKGYALENRTDGNENPMINLLLSPDYMVFVKRQS